MRADTRLPPYLPYPRFLLQADLTQTAKLLYALLLDRATLSQANGWLDEGGRIYLVFPIEKIAAALDRSTMTVKTALSELEDAGLIKRRRSGFSKPNRIYVKMPPDGQKTFQVTDRKPSSRMLMAALCSVVFLCGFSVTAYAGGGDEVMDYETEPVVETEPATEPEPAPTIEPGAGFAEKGNLVTRDLLYDKNTNKQFISVQTSGGNTFYIVIDYDKPTDEDGEQYETYFFSIVDEADLLAAMESAGVELPACTCKEKCVVGAINTDCPVCSINMGECAGMTPEPEPEPTTEPQPEEPAKKNGAGPLILVLAIFAIGGGAGWYFKIYRPQHQQAATPEDNYEEEMDAYNDFEDDGPPWDEDDPEPGEEDEA